MAQVSTKKAKTSHLTVVDPPQPKLKKVKKEKVEKPVKPEKAVKPPKKKKKETKKYDFADKFVKKEADTYDPLPHDEIVRLFKRIEKYSQIDPNHRKVLAARDKIRRHNARYVVRKANGYLGKGLDIEDLIQEGYLGLMKAIVKFDWRRGYRFSTYADWWIKEGLGRAVKNKGRMIRVPVQKLQQKVKVQKEWGYAHTELSFQPTSKQLAHRTGLTVAQVEEFKTFDYDIESLESPKNKNRETPLVETICSENALTPEDELVQSEELRSVHVALSYIGAEDARFIRRLYGMNGSAARSNAQMADIYRVPVPQIKRRAKDILEQLKVIILRLREGENNVYDSAREPVGAI